MSCVLQLKTSDRKARDRTTYLLMHCGKDDVLLTLFIL
jgi:hypothetical protein